MLEKRLRDIARPEMSTHVKVQQIEAIKSSRNTTTRLPLPEIVTFFATIVATVILFFALSNNSVPDRDDLIISTDVVLKDIVKATSLHNEKPKKMLDLTSVFYRDKLVSTNVEQLIVYEELLAKTTVEPFSWKGIRPNPGTDYLFELADGRTVYLKEFIAVDGGELYLINPQTMERFVFEYSDKVDFWDAWEKVFAVEMPADRWPIFVIIGIGFTAFVLFRRKKASIADEVNNTIPYWLSFWLWVIFGFMINNHAMFFGAQHIGFIFCFSIVFCIFYNTICNLFFNAAISRKKMLGDTLLLIVLLCIFYF